MIQGLEETGWKKFNLDLRPQGQIRYDKQAHPDIAEIDAKSIHVGRSSDYSRGAVQQLAKTRKASHPTQRWVEMLTPFLALIGALRREKGYEIKKASTLVTL